MHCSDGGRLETAVAPPTQLSHGLCGPADASPQPSPAQHSAAQPSPGLGSRFPPQCDTTRVCKISARSAQPKNPQDAAHLQAESRTAPSAQSQAQPAPTSRALAASACLQSSLRGNSMNERARDPPAAVCLSFSSACVHPQQGPLKAAAVLGQAYGVSQGFFGAACAFRQMCAHLPACGEVCEASARLPSKSSPMDDVYCEHSFAEPPSGA